MLLGLAILFLINELVRPTLLRWERKQAVRELQCYQREFLGAQDPQVKLFWAQEIIDCRARYRRRLGELPDS